MPDKNPSTEPASGPDPKVSRPRHHLRLAAISGIVAVAILGGGITAVAAASAPEPTTSTTTLPVPSATGTPPTGLVSPPVRRPRTPHLGGTVTSVAGSTVLIKDRDGFTRTIVLSTKTTYADGLNAALPVGTEIHAKGKVDANGTSLDATAIRKRPTAPAGGPRWGGRGGRRGHGGPPPAAGSAPGTSAPSTSSAAPTTS
jgi:hypothetical protein